MIDVKDKISKLLALAGSPNEHEAKFALLKARELMVEHKLLPEEVTRVKTFQVIRRKTGITCTKMTHSWAVQLSAVIAEHYCCKAFRNHRPKEKKVEIGFVGFEEDLEICTRIFKYAFDCVASRCTEIQSEHKGGWPARYIRELADAYGVGFCNGLKEAYSRQAAEHQEWGLILVTPKEVADEWSKLGKPTGFANAITVDQRKRDIILEGRRDGAEFNPASRIPEMSTAKGACNG
jgi:hypothetical protein